MWLRILQVGVIALTVSLEVEFEFAEDVGVGNDNERKVICRMFGKKVSYAPKLDVLQRSYEEMKL